MAVVKKAANGAMNIAKAGWARSGTALAVGGTALDVGFGAMTYVDSKQQGDSTPVAIAKGGMEFLLSRTVGFTAYMGIQAAVEAPRFVMNGARTLDEKSRSMTYSRYQPFANAQFYDNSNSYTMRQQGMALAQQSKYNLQHAMLGQEAQYLHR